MLYQVVSEKQHPGRVLHSQQKCFEDLDVAHSRPRATATADHELRVASRWVCRQERTTAGSNFWFPVINKQLSDPVSSWPRDRLWLPLGLHRQTTPLHPATPPRVSGFALPPDTVTVLDNL